MAARPSLRTQDSLTAEAFVERLRSDPATARSVVHVRTVPERTAEVVPLPDGLPPTVRAALDKAGRAVLFRHQREAIDLAMAGRNVVISTETSSGKSLCFQVPVLCSLAANPESRALFIFPTNPLANDQEASLRQLTAHLPEAGHPTFARLQGGMGSQKDQLAADSPQILLTNPEMVHLHLLPRHGKWSRMWRGLQYIVVDEIHLYRGAFGGHLANLLRRVRRCAWRYGAKPVVIAASATVGNPKALAEELCSAPFELIDRSAAPRGRRTTVLWQPPEQRNGRPRSYLDESVDLFRRALAAGLQTILFARSRQLVELMVSKLEEETGRSRIQLGVRAYRAGYLREEREVIEAGLRNGTVRGVVTTNALEVGIDIGSLDVCIIAGYPGSAMAMRQQAGRVGRRDRPAAIFVVASQNPLDTWMLHHPEALFDAEVEKAVVGRLNPLILRSHVASAAAEFPLWEKELDRLGGDVARKVAAELVERQEAHWATEDSRNVLIAHGRPHASVSLRTASQERWTLVGPEGDTVGEIDGASLAREAFPGAIYLHQGRSFRVKGHEEGRVLLARAPPRISTRVQGERQVAIGEVLRSRSLIDGFSEVVLARVDVTDRYSSFVETDGEPRGRVRLIKPPLESQLRTEGLVLRLAPSARERLQREQYVDIRPGLHAAEHVLSALCATLVLCDRDDVEGDVIDTTEQAAIVLFDRFPGGMGIASTAFDAADVILARAAETIDGCECSTGCPACIHMSRCLRGNEGVDKRSAQILLRLLRGLSATGRPVTQVPRPRRPSEAPKPRRERKPEAPATADAPQVEALVVGDLVEHAVYGAGRVLEVRPSGRVVVDFGDGKRRRIARTWLQKSRE
jgi:DEAD/DEAH box helicase domain-containing protein